MKNPGPIRYRLISGLAGLLPRRMTYSIGETLGVLSFLLLPGRRRNLYLNLGVVLGDPGSPALRRTGLRATVNLARSIVEALLVSRMDEEYAARHVRIIDKAGLKSILAGGRGVVLVTAHLGGWELGGFALARMGYKITTVAGVQLSPALSPVVRAMKARFGIRVVSADGGSLAIMRALRRGEVVALHIDGDQYLGGLETTFFGKRTMMPRGPAALALRTGAALVPAFAVRTSRRNIDVCVEEPIPTDGEDEAGLTARALAVVEAYVRRYPEQWCIFRPLWEAAR
jgi:KDO2-lipid IV(A) lauroyltransferase